MTISKQDYLTGSDVGIDYAHHKIHEGDHYKSGYQSTALDTGDTINLLFTTPNTDKQMHFTLTSQTTGQATVQFFRSPTVTTEGTATTKFNRNENSSNISEMIVKHTNVISSNGNKISEKWIGSDGFKESSGGTTRGNSEIILMKNTQYLILLTAESDGMKGAIGGDWYEE